VLTSGNLSFPSEKKVYHNSIGKLFLHLGVCEDSDNSESSNYLANEMSVACGANGEEEECMQGFDEGEGRNHSEGLCIGVRLILLVIWIVKYNIGIYE